MLLSAFNPKANMTHKIKRKFHTLFRSNSPLQHYFSSRKPPTTFGTLHFPMLSLSDVFFCVFRLLSQILKFGPSLNDKWMHPKFASNSADFCPIFLKIKMAFLLPLITCETNKLLPHFLSLQIQLLKQIHEPKAMICSASEVRMNPESKRKFDHYGEVEEVRQLKKRVAYLEEETHKMMQEMSQNTAERRSLLKEIYRHLKLIQEGGKTNGLSQVLYEDLNPSVVVRGGGGGGGSVAAHGHAESTMSSILCIKYNH